MLFMGIGTGISSSFVTKEAGLVHFFWDTIGDTGHIIVDPLGSERCPCGARGCLESIAAAPAIRTKAIREIQQGRQTMLSTIMATKGDLEAKDVHEAAEQGDQAAVEIMVRVGTAIGIAMTSLIHIFCPDVIVIGGGVSRSWNFIMEPISRTIHSMAGSWYQQQLKAIEVSRLGVNAGAIGSACLILFPEYRIDYSNP
jgi:predicted NBD/HSP70 family sugar kinase